MPNEQFGRWEAIAQQSPPLPIPLFQEQHAPKPVPLDALGPLRSAVSAIETVTQAPTAIAMQSVLAAASVAVQPFADVELLHGRAPSSLFLLTVAESGERKSACDRLATKAIAEVEAERLRRFAAEWGKYEDARRSASAGRKSSEDDEVIEGPALGRPATDVSEPLYPAIRLGDATFEGIVAHFERGNPSVGLMSDEGGQILGGHSMKRENKLKTAAGLSKLWDGAPVDRRRASSPPVVLAGRRMSLHLMIQPGVASDAFADPTFRDQGLLSRMLIAWPKSRIGYRLIPDDSDTAAARREAEADIAIFNGHIRELLESFLPTRPDGKELTPRLLSLTAAARQILIAFYNEVEIGQRDDGHYANIRGFASKTAEQAGRLAAILTLFNDRFAQAISDEQMRSAVELVRWYLDEALRVLDCAYVSRELRDAEALREWLVERFEGDIIDVRTATRCGPSRLRNADTLKALFAKLVDQRWLIPIDMAGMSSTRKQAWRIVRTKDACEAEEEGWPSAHLRVAN